MRKRSVIILITTCLICCNKVSIAQNLVFNGSFEIRDSIFQNSDLLYHNCPYKYDDGIENYNPQLRMAKKWYNIQGKYLNQWYSTFDYFHSCGNDINNLPFWITESKVTVPKNKAYIEYQYSRTGEEICGWLVLWE